VVARKTVQVFAHLDPSILSEPDLNTISAYVEQKIAKCTFKILKCTPFHFFYYFLIVMYWKLDLIYFLN